MKNWLRSLLSSSPTGFGSAGIIRQRQCGAINIIGDWDGQLGVETDEDGMSISSFTVRYFPEVNNELKSNVGETRALGQSDKFCRDVTMEGEMTGSDYPSALATAIAVNNDVDDLGDGSGDLLLMEATVSQKRGEWRTISISLKSYPGVTVT